MKKISVIKSKEIANRIEKMNYFDVESFNCAAKRFVKAIKEGRIIATVSKVSASGMSRNIKIVELQKTKGSDQYTMLNFCCFFQALGYRVNDKCEIVRHGCGMDMIYDTLRASIDTLNYLGMLSDKESGAIRVNYNYL